MAGFRTPGVTLPRDEVARKLTKLAERIRNNVIREAHVEASKVYLMEIGHQIDRWAEKPSGKLERSFKAKSYGTGEATETLIFTTSRYAMIHDSGKPAIRARFVKWLTIPLTPAAKRRGSPKYWIGDRLFLIRSKRGNRLLVTKRGKKGVKPQYLLRKRVRLRKKDYLGKALTTARPKIQERFAKILRVTVDRL